MIFNIKRSGVSMFAIILSAFAMVPTVQAEDNTGQGFNTLFILDASGSMWGQINGKPKIAIAKEVMTKLAPELPDNSRIGLIAYGHRRKGDCNDVETLVKLGGNHKQAVLGAVKGLNAKGKTPLTRSVNQAIGLLRAEEDASTVVLVSDGIESCGGDPCAAVKAAKTSGVKFILHTVGFGLSKKESAQLQCMAKAGGGQYFQANNAEELLKSARKAVKSKGPGILKLTLRSNGKPVNAWVKLVGQGSIGLTELTSDAGVKPGHIWHLQPGTYKLETYPAGLHGVSPMVVSGIKIDSGKTVTKALDFNQSTLHLIATNNGKPVVVQINLKNLASGKTVFDTATYSTFTMRGVKTPYDVKVLPGKYRLTAQIPKSSIPPFSEDINLTSAGKIVEKTVRFESGTLRVTAEVNKTPAKAEIYVTQVGDKKHIFETMPYIGANTPLEIKLAAGRYDLHISPMGIEGVGERVVKGIEVKADGVANEVVSFDAALTVPVYVQHLGAGEWTSWDSSEGAMGLLDASGGKYIGFYNQEDHGRLLLQRKGDDMTGYWVENSSHQQCASERDGSRYWGRIKWKFDRGFNTFSGTWSYCDADPAAGNGWHGKRNALKSVTTHA